MSLPAPCKTTFDFIVNVFVRRQLPAGSCTTPPLPLADEIAAWIAAVSSWAPLQGVFTLITFPANLNPAPQPTPKANGSPEPETTVILRSSCAAPVPFPLSTMITETEVGPNDVGAVTTKVFSLLALRLIVAGIPSTVTDGLNPGARRFRPITRNAPPGTSCSASR